MQHSLFAAIYPLYLEMGNGGSWITNGDNGGTCIGNRGNFFPAPSFLWNTTIPNDNGYDKKVMQSIDEMIITYMTLIWLAFVTIN